MNGKLIKKEIGILLRNPLVYLGMLLMVMIVFWRVSPYWNFYDNLQKHGTEAAYSEDGDVIDGYIPTSQDELYQTALEKLQEYLVTDCSWTDEEAKLEIEKVKKWSVPEIASYFKEQHKIAGVRSTFAEKAYHSATKEEMDAYLQEAFGENGNKTYTKEVSYKYVDYLGISSILFAMLVFVLLLYRDMKKDIYALIHVKPLSAMEFLIGKLVAGISVVFGETVPLTLIMDFLTMKAGAEYGLSVNFYDFWMTILMFHIPSILATGSLMILISLVFCNSVPTIPAMLLYYLYCNMGSYDSTLVAWYGYRYQAKPLSLFTRFPSVFGTNEFPKGGIFNLCFLIFLTVFALVGSIKLWERRRSV